MCVGWKTLSCPSIEWEVRQKYIFSLHNSLFVETNYHMKCHTEIVLQILNKRFHRIRHKIIQCSLFYLNIYAVTTPMSFPYCSLQEDIKLMTWLPSFLWDLSFLFHQIIYLLRNNSYNYPTL